MKYGKGDIWGIINAGLYYRGWGGGEMGKRNYCWKAIFFLRLLHEYANWAIAYSRPDGEVINWSLGKSTRRYNLIL